MPNFDLIGSSMLECMSNMQWNGSIPYCRRKYGFNSISIVIQLKHVQLYYHLMYMVRQQLQSVIGHISNVVNRVIYLMVCIVVDMYVFVFRFFTNTMSIVNRIILYWNNDYKYICTTRWYCWFVLYTINCVFKIQGI
jgi:hypothetical protein